MQKNQSPLAESYSQLALNFQEATQIAESKPAKHINPPSLSSIPILRCRRRTLGITVHRGRVEVRAPMRMAKRDIDAFITEKWAWINNKVLEQQTQMSETLRIVDAAAITVLDQPHTLKVVVSEEQGRPIRRSSIQQVDGKIVIKLKASKDNSTPSSTEIEQWATRLFYRWITTQAANYMTIGTNTLVKQLGLSKQFSAVKYRRTKSKWGHCTSDGHIQYNPLIVLAPKNIVDYIIAHEVCHLVHANHSSRFWALVDKTYESRIEAEQWLKHSGHRIAIEL